MRSCQLGKGARTRSQRSHIPTHGGSVPRIEGNGASWPFRQAKRGGAPTCPTAPRWPASWSEGPTGSQLGAKIGAQACRPGVRVHSDRGGVHDPQRCSAPGRPQPARRATMQVSSCHPVCSPLGSDLAVLTWCHRRSVPQDSRRQVRPYRVSPSVSEYVVEGVDEDVGARRGQAQRWLDLQDAHPVRSRLHQHAQLS